MRVHYRVTCPMSDSQPSPFPPALSDPSPGLPCFQFSRVSFSPSNHRRSPAPLSAQASFSVPFPCAVQPSAINHKLDLTPLESALTSLICTNLRLSPLECALTSLRGEGGGIPTVRNSLILKDPASHHQLLSALVSGSISTTPPPREAL